MAVNQKLSILFWLNRTKVNSKGLAPIWARITIDGMRAECSTGKHIMPEHWRTGLGLPNKNSPDATEITKRIFEIKFSLKKHFKSLAKSRDFVTAYDVKRSFLGINTPEDQYMFLGVLHQFHSIQMERARSGALTMSRTFKWKQLADSCRDYIRLKFRTADIAFANDLKEYGGGYIVIGVEETDGSPILPPFGLQKNQIDKIQKEILELCFLIKPNIFPTVEPVEFQGKQIIIIWVTTGEERPYAAPSTLGQKGQHRIYVRPLSVTRPATPELDAELRQLASQKHFDDRVNTKASIEDLDLGLILAYLQEVKSNLYSEAVILSMTDLAVKMGIARGPKENIRPLNVGLLMFSKNPELHFPGCKTNLIEFNEDETTYSEIGFTGPVHNQIRNILEYIKNNLIRNYVSKQEGKAESTKFYNYPFQALEEIVVNSLYHRSYENQNPNEIRIYREYQKGINKIIDPRRIEIHSYPGPLPPIDEKALTNLQITARNYRNLRLGDWLKNLKLAEKYATGIPSIVKSLRVNGSPDPIFSTDESRTHFSVVLRIHPDTPAEITTTFVTEQLLLSDIQQKILELLLSEPNTKSIISAALASDLTSDFEYLISKDFLRKKSIGNEDLLYVTLRGIDSLRRSF